MRTLLTCLLTLLLARSAIRASDRRALSQKHLNKRSVVYPPTFDNKGTVVAEQNREVEQAVSALTTEILKLTALEGQQRDDLCITIQNAFSRLALAILAQSNQTQEDCLEDALTSTVT
jgi:hypothetical protein